MIVARLPLARDVPAVTAAEMSAVDTYTSGELGIPVDVLMENASRQIAAGAREALGGRVAGRRVLGVVGPGNNGADVLGALRHLSGWGAVAQAVLASPDDHMREPVRAQARRLVAAGGTLVPGITECDLLVDGLLGYSARGEPRGGVRDLVIAANRTSVPILAADVPSGVNPDTGTVPGEAIRAVATVTLALPKSGLLAAAAAPYVGELVLADIGMPAAAFATIGVDTSRVFIDGDLLRVAT